jgi:hypothetical protein
VQSSPINPNLQEDTTFNTRVGYRATDRTSPQDFFIEGSVRLENGENILTFLVVTEVPGQPRGMVRGAEFFAAMMGYFAAIGTAVDVIEAEWSNTNPRWVTNLDAFNKESGLRPTLEEAATHAPTGKYATRHQYTKVEVVRANPPGATGAYTDVLVRFRR